MNLNSKDPREQGQNDHRLWEIKRNGFELVPSANFPGFAYQTRCCKCGHKLKVNQFVWRLRHSLKCTAE